MPEYVVGLNKREIDELIKKLEKYERDLDDVNDIFVRRLAELGIEIANVKLLKASGIDKEKPVGSFRIDERGLIGYSQATLILSGEQVLFIEFGAGIYFNNGNAHPMAGEFGYGVGTYPHQKYALNPNGWWYKDDREQLHHSFGTEATMPMYSASIEIMNQIYNVAKEVFRNVG